MPLHVAFLGPDMFSAYVDLVRGLKQVGARVSGLGHSPYAALDPQLRYFLDDYLRLPTLLDKRTVQAGVREIDRRCAVDRLETGDEALVSIAAEVRESFGLPGLSVRSATLCRDKPAMKEALRAAGVPCAASAAVRSIDELEAFIEREGYPVILKPRSALGGLGTHRADHAAELLRAVRSLGLDRGRSVAVEEFVEGHEGIYDTLSVDGQVVHEFIAHYYPTVLEALSDRALAPQIAATNRIDASSYDELKAMGRKVIQVLGIGTSATHMEWFFGPKGLKFSEIGARPPGERIWDLYSVGNHIDLWREWAMLMIHKQPGARPNRRLATGSVQVRPDREGRIAGYRGLGEVLARCRPWLTEHHLPRHGAPTVPIYKGYYTNAWFRLRHPDYDELQRLMSFIGERLEVRAVA